eukprot:TRINITY_DN32875_c0_g1_i3.p1 TRINITY_DN32875_c0_g1~~TRINITY_DN32875_c0_g1_i3.p1  ORF type:complete len:107 (+),score=7.68 TRINITY_DN32875_c0_g1_i3:797-1117(+)
MTRKVESTALICTLSQIPQLTRADDNEDEEPENPSADRELFALLQSRLRDAASFRDVLVEGSVPLLSKALGGRHGLGSRSKVGGGVGRGRQRSSDCGKRLRTDEEL